jgi:hypothetical protein
MRSPGHIARTNIESIEFKRALAKSALAIRERFLDYTPIVCVDSQSWRKVIWQKYYYAEVGKKAFQVGDFTAVIPKDGFWYTISLKQDGACGLPVKLDKEEYLSVSTDGNRKPLKAKPFQEGIDQLIGSYKGNRKHSDWKFATPYATFKEWSSAIAPHFAGLLRGGIVKVDCAEADDIIAYAVMTAPDYSQVIVMSTDQDISWSETKGVGQLMDRAWCLESWDTLLHKPVSEDRVVENIQKKILLGDPGDDIGPCLSKNGDRVTPRSLSKYLDNMGILDPHTLERNQKLIYLREDCPLANEIQEALENSMENIPPSLDIRTWGLDQKEALMACQEGALWREKDKKAENWL